MCIGIACGNISLATTTWQIVLSSIHQDDEAIRAVLDDLKEEGESLGISFIVVADESTHLSGNLIIIGDTARNRYTARLMADKILTVDRVSDPEGYAIRTLVSPTSQTMVVAGGSIIGDVYGLYWLWDRMRVEKRIPEINTIRIPAMKVRMAAAWGRKSFGGSSKEQNSKNRLGPWCRRWERTDPDA